MAGENADHIPDPGKHRTLFYGYYANRVRGDRAEEEPGKVEEEPAKKRRSSTTWARLIAKVFQADPLASRKCGGETQDRGLPHSSRSHELLQESRRARDPGPDAGGTRYD
jgi:hypothetical protein